MPTPTPPPLPLPLGAMGLLVDRSGDAAFFEGRKWLDRGVRYPEVARGQGSGLGLG